MIIDKNLVFTSREKEKICRKTDVDRKKNDS